MESQRRHAVGNHHPESISEVATLQEDAGRVTCKDLESRAAALGTTPQTSSGSTDALSLSSSWGKDALESALQSERVSPHKSGASSCSSFDASDPPMVPSIYRLEQTKFTVKQPPHDVFHRLRYLLADNSIACDANPDVWAITCTAYVCLTMIKFTIQFYKGDGGVIVEFNRQDGCCVVFSALFQSIKRRLLEDGKGVKRDGVLEEVDNLVSPICPRRLASMHTLPPPPLIGGRNIPSSMRASSTDEVSLGVEDMQAFEGMLTSPLTEIVAMGLRCVGKLAESGSTPMLLAHEGVAAALSQLLTNPPSPSLRCPILATIAQFTSDYTSLTPQQRSWVASHITPLVEGAGGSCPHIQREALRGLAKLTSNAGPLVCAEVLHKHTDLENILQQHTWNSDPYVSMFASEVLSRLEGEGGFHRSAVVA